MNQTMTDFVFSPHNSHETEQEWNISRQKNFQRGAIFVGLCNPVHCVCCCLGLDRLVVMDG
jgi:hypothetical protein